MSPLPTIRQFELQAARCPDAPAVVHEAIRLSYGDLEQRANRLAHLLSASGVGPDTLVAIALPRSPELIVAMLAVLKAGGAYVPLDPCYPAARLRYMLEDSRAALLVTRGGLLDEHAIPALRTLVLDQVTADLAAQSATALPEQAGSAHLAYVIYTSGSTGAPKGVMIERGALDRFVLAIGDAYAIDNRDRVLQFASPSFDVSIEEIFPCLCRGATLVLRNEAMLGSVATFVQRSKALELTVWDLPTAYWHLIAAALSQGQVTLPPTLRLVVIGGEQANAEMVRQWQRAVGLTPQLINAYGPTETTVEASLYPVRSLLGEGERLPIGRPLGDARFHILDEHMTPVAHGAAGELYIGGERLARGYLHRPELTAESFVHDPFTERAGARLYKTRDLVRLREDGEVEYLGRTDEQVKIQGFRIEPGEIEAVLATHPRIAEVAVIAREDVAGDKRLVAYVVAEGELPGATAVVQAFLKDRLPHYMVPRAVVVLEALPRTPSDKVDRRALPEPGHDRPDLAHDFVAPQTESQRRLAAIWEETLGVAPIGATDDFFALGGHSLMAVQILWRVQTVFGCEVGFRDLLEHTRLDAFADWLDRREPHAEGTRTPVLERVSRDAPVAASFAQERVQFMETLAPSMTAYQFQESLRWQGALDVAVLQRALSEIVRRHEIFRTTFETIDGKLMQTVCPAFDIELPVADLRALPDAQRAPELDRLRQAFVMQPFDVSRLPLLRWLLVRLSDNEHELIHVEHHMVHDGWSFNIFLRELLALYRAFADGQPSPLAEPPQFADFAVWQRRWARSDAAKAQLAYWTDRLAGSPPLLELPYDRPRPPEQSFRGGMERMELSLDLCHRLRRFDATEKVTLFMSMYAVFLVLMQRYSGQDDLCIGTGVANRRLSAIADMIGMVVNNVVLRNNLTGDLSFRDLLAQVRETTLQAYANEDLPFDHVVEALKPVRQLSYNPLFQVMFSFHDAQLPDLAQIPGLAVSQHESVSNRSAKFDLDVVVIPRTEQRLGQRANGQPESQITNGITLVWEYATDLFDATTVRRMMDEYRVLLEQVLDAPEGRLSALDPLDAEARRRVLLDWNRPVAEPDARSPQAACLHELVEAQAARTPYRVAIVAGAQQLTYGELDAQANRLAHHLRGLGVGPDVPVGIGVERSLDLLVGLLGILKAGGCYVPLDPGYPAERLAHMLDDSGARVLVTTPRQRPIPTRGPVQRVCLETDRDAIARHDAGKPEVAVGAQHLAYVIYTSGSTGTPKGVMVEHRNVVSFIRAAVATYGIEAEDRVLQFASPSFDAAVEEIFATLSVGARLVLRPDSALDSIADFADFSRAQALTVWDLPTAYWHMLVHELHEGRITLPASLRLVILGGERALPARIQQWLARAGTRPRLLNSYGPTESTVVATVSDLSEAGSLLAGREAPIGRPLAHARVHVLDRRGQPVPIGVPGELHLGGSGVARGYMGRPELTAERFIPDPFSTEPGARLYRSGDLVRWRHDGQLEYLGRNDNQVKIRGLRIELGEIESVLNRSAGVAQAAVIAREDSPGVKRLVAYVCAGSSAGLDTEALRRDLASTLPVYMVPSAFVVLERLPMTPNGKLDTRALPLPERVAATDEARATPRNPVEERLASIWSRVLGLEAVGIHDNFFELGGDSIISIQVISQARQAGLRFTARQLFQNQTIAQLAGVVSTEDIGRTTPAPQGLVTGEAPLTPIQHWFFAQDWPEPHHFNQSALLDVPAGTDAARLEQALRQLVEHHDALRLRYLRTAEGRWQQVHGTPEQALSFERVSMPAGPSEAQRGVVREVDAYTQTRLALEQGPLVRAVLFTAEDGQPGYLLIVAHHLVVDAVSWRILREDLTTLYRQLSQGEAMQLPAKTTSFQAWGERLRTYAASPALQRELDHWAPAQPPILPALPLDFPAEPGCSAIRAIAYETRFLDAEETRALLQDVPAAYNTRINDALLAALVLCLQRWTGQPHACIDLEGHGREDLFEDVDLSRTVGWLTAMHPVVLRASAGSPGETLKAVKEQLRAVPGRGLGHGVLRHLSDDPGVRARMVGAPQAQVSFNYLGRFDQVTGSGQGLLTMAEWKSEHSLEGDRPHLLALSGLVADERLEMRWEYSTRLHRQDTVARLADDYMQTLRDLLDHCRGIKSRGYTPSDFSAAKLGQKQLDKLVSKLRKRA